MLVGALLIASVDAEDRDALDGPGGAVGRVVLASEAERGGPGRDRRPVRLPGDWIVLLHGGLLGGLPGRPAVRAELDVGPDRREAEIAPARGRGGQRHGRRPGIGDAAVGSVDRERNGRADADVVPVPGVRTVVALRMVVPGPGIRIELQALLAGA